MITYRKAVYEDYKAIGLLHARSWQLHYRGSFSDEYLNQKAEADRLSIWKKRLEYPSNNQFILVALFEGRVCGFVCTYLDKDPVWGAFLDNLHVSFELKGKGIGKALMAQSAARVLEQNPTSKLYLYVLEKNYDAMRFYERIGGIKKDKTTEKNPGGGYAKVWRYVWDSPQIILHNSK